MNWTQAIDTILEPLLALDPRIGFGIEGCTPEDLATIEAALGLTPPSAFTALLGRIGRCRGRLLPGADFGFPDLLRFRAVADSLLSEHGLFLHPKDLVLSMEQGYQFFFCRVDAGDDPVIYFYDDDDPRFVPLGFTLTGWLNVCITEELALWRDTLAAEARGHK